MVNAIRDGGEPVPSFARAAEVQAVIEAQYESHARKAWVEPARSALARAA